MARGKPHGAARQRAGSEAIRPGPKNAPAQECLFGRPWILAAATALWVARPMFPSEAAAARGDGLPAVMLWIVLAIVWLLGVIGRRQFRLRFGWVDAALAVFVVWHTIAAIWAAGHLSPRPAVNMLWEWVGLAVSFWLTRQVLAGRRETRALAAVMIALAVGLAGYGLYQYFYDLPATRVAYRADPDRYLLDAGLWYARGSPERAMFENRLESVEPLATFALTNSFAGFLAPWLVVLAGIAAVGQPQTRRRVALWGIAGAAIVIATCLLLTKSRSACLATLFGLLLVAAAWRRKAIRLPWRPIAVAAIGLAILVTGVVAMGGLDVEVFSEATKSLGYRGQYWQATLAMIADHPVLGCGPGNFQDSYNAYKLPAASEEIADPHNFLLEIWATAGTPAMLAFAAAIAVFFARLGKRGPVAKTPPDVPDPTPSEKADDHPLFVYGGAALGLLLAIPVGFLSVAPSLFVVMALVCPLAAGAVFVLSGWVEDGDLPASIPTVGVVVLLVNLSAAGGIGFASVGGTLWLLLAIALNRTAGADGWTLPRAAGAGVLVAFGGVVYACYASAYGPVLRCQAAMWLAQRHPAMAEQYLLEAAQADPLSSEPWGQLASRTFAEWKERRAEKALGRFRKYAETALQQAPNSAASWQFSGERYYQAYEITHDPGLLCAAAAAFRRAAELYPNSAMNRARLAIALRAAGDETGYRAERDRALELDEVTPHLDKKLDAELRNSLQRSNSRHD